jgi:toxin ParE1/3/4
MKPIRYFNVAATEREEAMIWYETQRHGLGEEFLDAFNESIIRIRQNPRLGRPAGKRRRVLLLPTRWPYLILYREDTELIWILAVFHGSRDPTILGSR